MRKNLILALIAVSFAVGTAQVQAQGWGNLKGKFVFDGSAKDPAKLAITKDAEVCGKHGLVDESLIVGKDGGIANVLVSLYLAPGAKAPAIHESYESDAKAEVVLDNNKCRFEPHITLLRTTQTLVIKNSDPVGHNTKADLIKNKPFNDLIPAGGMLKKSPFGTEEILPMQVSCSIHPWMRAHLVIRKDPYMTVSAEDGTFEIKNIPAGKHNFRAWQESAGYIQKVSVKGKAESWAKGRFEVTIKNGEDFDLGEIKIPAASFK